MALTAQDKKFIEKLFDLKLAKHHQGVVNEMDAGFERQRNEIIDEILTYFRNNHPSKQDLEEAIENLEAKIDHLPTKDEFYDLMDQNAKDYKVFQETEPLIAEKLSNHESRLTKLEHHLKPSLS